MTRSFEISAKSNLPDDSVGATKFCLSTEEMNIAEKNAKIDLSGSVEVDQSL